ncbi:hypothetical protein Q9L58_008054 [Maublancomyces gigas]|uniref:Uncharacterized protein n=1 Tax=Discina gigas TaxID=1032678 RepID=A0ABR3GAS7_9PEZI
MAPKKHRVHETPEFPTSSDPFNPNPGPPLEPDQAPSPSPISRSPSTASANPFLLQIQQPPSDIRRSLDLSDSTPEPHAASDPRPGRQSLDAEAFKRLMLTGQSTAPTIAPESSSTDTSSVSRQSIFEPILETDTAADAEVEIETPRTSHEIEDDERALSPKLGCVVRPPPPPPPPPRSRGTGGGTKSPISPSLSGSPPPPPPPSRPASMYSISQIDKSLPPPPPPPQLLPLLALSPSQKRVAPSPPLSRRHSIQSKSNPVKTRPPPPPIRRTKTTNTRRLAITTLPAPPLPPLPRRISRSFTPDSQLDEGLTENRVGVKEDDGLDILLDLQKLQREVDELRGKYEGR